MRVCDRHPTEKAADGIALLNDDTRADLCAACVAMVRDFLGKPEQKSVDPEKPKRSILGLRKN